MKNFFLKVTKEGNEELTELENVSTENESHRWNGIIPWLHLNHFALEEGALVAFKYMCKWVDCEGVDGRNLALLKKLSLKFVLNKFNDQILNLLMHVLIFIVIL